MTPFFSTSPKQPQSTSAMASQYSSNAPLPQGFSVYQPQLGAQLQFFPALGSQELDDMMNAYIPGPAALKEKRATISLDFLEHSQLTGQTFKFYPVYYSTSPVAASPVNSIATSSFNTSPVNSTLDWSQASASPSVSSRSSISKSRRTSKSNNMVARYSAIDLSNLPGMKIMTKDGEDVTDSASRGSKTKEQRDHAHLMRIIKACDSCRRKKIRCDPDHKKRSASQTQPQSATKAAKKARTSPPAAATPAPQKPVAAGVSISKLDDNPGRPVSLLGIDPTFTFAGLDSFESTDQITESWEEFIQYPPAEVEDNYDFFLDPQGYFSSSQSSASSSSASPSKALTPASQQDLLAISGLEEGEGMSSQSTSPQLPFMQDNYAGSASSYTDFNLFSPSSTFSEDDRMVPISSTRMLSPSQPSASGSETAFFDSFDPDGHTLATDWSGTSEPVSPLETGGLVAAANTSLPWYDPGHNAVANPDQDSRDGVSAIAPTGWIGGVRIAHPPGGSLLVTMESGSGMEVIANSAPPGRSNVSGSEIVSIAIHGSGTSVDVTTSQPASTALQFRGDIQEESLYDTSPTERRIASETPARHSSWLSPGQADDFRTELTSERSVASASASAPSSLATATNRPFRFSTGSEESPARVCDATEPTKYRSVQLTLFKVQTEPAANRSVIPGASPGVSPGGLRASFGESNALLATAHATAGEDTTVPASTTALAWPHITDVRTPEILRNRSGLPAQQPSGEINVHQQSASRSDNGIQPLSPRLLQAISPKEDVRAADERAALVTSKPSEVSLRQVQTTQAAAAMLVATLVGATFAGMMGLSAVFSFASLILAMRSVLQRLETPSGFKATFASAPSTMSSSRSKDSVYPWAGPSLRKYHPLVSRDKTSCHLAPHFSSFLNGAIGTALVAPMMG
ncbi:hypothetical protein M431DRAFT_177647 [Trichoderma harzianum CBS 226.95]|uniref:Zn(2)-C6 fungal-type domain-containing protein n=1 Tax=Trichoderma harzianum CBS 226.95 TaxID=983964 RepID=A0A2T4ATH4_TRIHA|nr:hypothetical protein M431DRAFT_177647 [Trichoderma harzianum CBS 226.95]PTB60339.1 hypothetical protein M431DRAFT_177647 [Trichoderma harzianum CBS 226.95]